MIVRGKENSLKRVSIAILAVIFLATVFGCTKREDVVLAEVNGKKITVKDFEDASKVMENKYLPKTNDLAGKKELLNHIIDKEVMALKAKAAGYEKEKWFVDFWEKFKNPFLVAAMENEYIIKKIKVTDQEVKDYFDKMHYEYTLSQIIVPNEEDAIAVRQKIMNGADFAEMAKQYSMGPSARDGGFIGTQTVGKMYWWIEEALFNMKEGDVSQPLRTNSGYALIKVHRIMKIQPELDMSYARKRVKAIKEKKGIEKLKAKIEKDIGLKFLPDAIDIAYNSLPPDVPFKDIVTYKVTRQNAPKVNVPPKYKDMILCQYNDGVYTLRDFEKIYESLPLPERPRREYGKANIVEEMHKVIFDKVLPVYAEKQLHILDIPEIKQKLESRREQFLVYKLYQDQVKDRVSVTEREIEDYYNKHLDDFIKPERRDMSIVLVKNLQKAKEVVMKAKNGMDFARLVAEYSEDPKAKENNGRTGLVMKGHYPDIDDAAFKLPEGGISDPIQTPRGWVVVKVEKIERGQVPTLEEAAQSISKAIKSEKAERILQEKLKRWRKNYDIVIYEKNLKKAKLMRTRSQS